MARPSPPLKLIVSIRKQRISVWDGFNKLAEAPISSGMSGYETPTGVFSILEKNKVHFSNLYNDAPMPFMQRLTWSGVALHAGALPGYPASHGCIRLPYSFARELFEMTRIGARVIVARDDLAPQPIRHGKLPVPLPPAEQVATAPVVTGGGMLIGVATAAPATEAAFVPTRTRASVAAQRAAELAALTDAIAKAETERDYAEARTKDAVLDLRDAAEAVDEARTVLRPLVAARDAARRSLAAAEAELRSFVTRTRREPEGDALLVLARQEDEFENRIAAAHFEIDDVEAEIADNERHVSTLTEAMTEQKRQHQLALEDLTRATSALKEAQAAKAAADRANQRRNLPVTVFVSRKSGKLSVRQGFEPLFEAEIAVDHRDEPIGTHIFTALDYEAGERALSWSVVSVVTPGPESETRIRRSRSPSHERPPRMNLPQTADHALSRLHIPHAVLERIAEYVKPGSTFMVSDLDMSNETGKGTDFVLLTR